MSDPFQFSGKSKAQHLPMDGLSWLPRVRLCDDFCWYGASLNFSATEGATEHPHEEISVQGQQGRQSDALS